jgi:ADP-heptose:LPS heptosyltransferase
MRRLHIYDRRERALVRAADAALAPLGLLRRALTSASTQVPRRILCLRLERIGDLLMTLPALAELRRLAPAATIDLVVGSWNAPLASAIRDVDTVETMDAAWLVRGSGGAAIPALLRQAAAWRRRHYDLAINFEPDIRTNLLVAASGARRRIGFSTGGGAPLLDLAIEHDPRIHTTDNAVGLVRAAFDAPAAASRRATIAVPAESQRRADALLAPVQRSLTIGVHVSGGRPIKQWPEDRFAEIASRLAHERDAAIVLTGSADDRAMIDAVKAKLPSNRVINVSAGEDLLTVAGVLARLNLLVTGDTGPMHLAHAVGTPVVAIFGPSDPVRYAIRDTRSQVVRVDLPCSPCNRIRLPPARCAGHTPNCLSFITTAQVWAAIDEVLRHSATAPTASAESPHP